ncbi:kinase-like domain-containing protein, partial [Butyriboletus roseoflavus]
HKVAHCDIKPGNAVVDTELDSKTSPQLYIIDFDIAQFFESEETMIQGWCGTPSWTAPEIGSRHGQIKRHSPILADRWAYGRMIQYFAKYIPTHVNKERLLALAQQLLSVNLRARPPMNPGEAGNL